MMPQLDFFSKEVCPLCGGEYGGHKGIYINDDFDEAVIDGVPIRLTKREAQMLAALVQVHPRVARKSFIMDYVYGLEAADDVPEEKIIDVFMCKLRKILKPFGYGVKSTFGIGFTLVEKDISDGPKKQAA